MEATATLEEMAIPDIKIKATIPPIMPPLSLSKFDLTSRINKNVIVDFKEDTFKK